MKVAENVLDMIGKTSMVRLNRVNKAETNVLAKLEYLNPSGSLKDRIALKMIEQSTGGRNQNVNTTRDLDILISK